MDKDFKEIKKELDNHGLLDEFILRNNYEIGHDPYWQELINNYSEDEIIAFCSDNYAEGDVLMWLEQGINYDLIYECIKKHEIWD